MGERGSSAVEERCAMCGGPFGYNVCFVIDGKNYCHECHPTDAEKGRE